MTTLPPPAPAPRTPTPELASLAEKLAGISGALESHRRRRRAGSVAPGAVKAPCGRGFAFTI